MAEDMIRDWKFNRLQNGFINHPLEIVIGLSLLLLIAFFVVASLKAKSHQNSSPVAESRFVIQRKAENLCVEAPNTKVCQDLSEGKISAQTALSCLSELSWAEKPDATHEALPYEFCINSQPEAASPDACPNVAKGEKNDKDGLSPLEIYGIIKLLSD